MKETAIIREEDAKDETFEWGTLRWHASKKLGNSDALTLALCTLKPGVVGASHYHPNCDEIVHVLRGNLMHSIEDGEEVLLSAGDTITLPANLVHYAKNIGDEDAVLVICFSSPDRQTIKDE